MSVNEENKQAPIDNNTKMNLNDDQTSSIFRQLAGMLYDAKRRGANATQLGKSIGIGVSENPDLKNRVLKNLKTIGYLPDRGSIENALEKPQENEKLLRQIGANLFINSFPMYKLARFYDGVLTYKYIIIPQNVSPKHMEKPRYKSEQRFVNQWMKKLNPNYQLRRIVQEVVQSGKRAYCLREIFSDGKKIKDEDIDQMELSEGIIPTYDSANRKVKSVFLQELPDDYIKIVGKSMNGSYYRVAFNFAYFLNEPEAKIEDYPPIFKKYFDIINGNTKTTKDKKKFTVTKDNIKNITKEIKSFEYSTDFKNGNYNYYFWVDIPSDECQVFSMDESSPLQASNFMGLFLMGGDLQGYNLLQQQLTSVPLFSMVIGQIPIDKEKRDQPLILNTDHVDYFTNAINDLMPNGTTYAMTPTEDNKVVQFNEQPNATKVYTSALQDMMGTSGIGGLLSTTDKPNLSQIKTSQLTEKRFVDVFYAQFEDFINKRFERMFDNGYLKYDWEVKMFGDVFSDKDDQETLLKGISQGFTFNLPKYLAHIGLTVEDAEALSHQVRATKLYDLMQPTVSAFQQSGKDSENGRKEKSDDDVDNDNTAKSKEAGSNKNQDRISFNFDRLSLEEVQENLEKLQEIIKDMEGGE